MSPRPRLLALLAIVVLVCAGPAPLQAQLSYEVVDGLVRDTYTTIRDDALRPPDQFTLLHHTALAAQQALTSSGVSELPPLPILTGQEPQDLASTASYVQAAVAAVPPAGVRILADVLRAMVRTVSDPQAAIYAPLELTRYHRDLYGEHSGIGVQVDVIQGRIVMSDVTSTGPAGRAGVQIGDTVVDLDGRAVVGNTPDQIMERLRGAPGTTLSLTLRRADGTLVRLSLAREASRENPTRWKMLAPRFGYLRLLEFPKGASTDIDRALTGLKNAGAVALLLDLRKNGGGLFDEGIAVASAFLPDGMVAMEEHRGTLTPLDVLPNVRRFLGPIVVLVSGFTASAAEIVAGALQDNGVPLVGEKTFGKGTIQTIYTLRGGWGLRLTTSSYYTRSGRAIDGRGLQPDVRIPLNEDLVQSSQDVQLQEATAVLQARLASIPRVRP
ncbi:MAG TPA: S41 family peptidase [bacterium]|nr:S41 family peptidase [bacterium]